MNYGLDFINAAFFFTVMVFISISLTFFMFMILDSHLRTIMGRPPQTSARLPQKQVHRNRSSRAAIILYEITREFWISPMDYPTYKLTFKRNFAVRFPTRVERKF